MNQEPLPQSLEQGIELYALKQHVSHDQAVLMLIESGLERESNRFEKVNCRPHKGPQPPLRIEDAEEIIGLFANSPEIMDNILKEVETRAERYSSRL